MKCILYVFELTITKFGELFYCMSVGYTALILYFFEKNYISEINCRSFSCAAEEYYLVFITTTLTVVGISKYLCIYLTQTVLISVESK